MGNKVDVTWYSPICDSLLRKIYYWLKDYHKGDPSADRKYVSPKAGLIDKVTRYANKLRFTTGELDHLVRLLDAVASKDVSSTERKLVEHFKEVRRGIKRGRLYPGGDYEVILDDYYQDVEETLNMLMRAKSSIVETIDDIFKEQITTGKSLFEV